MLARLLSAMLPVNVRGMWIGTFHGLCNRFLRAHHKLANLPVDLPDTGHAGPALKPSNASCKQFNIDDERFPPKQTAVVHCRLPRKTASAPSDVPSAHSEEGRKKVEIYAAV